MKRDWTYIGDIVAGFVAALDHPHDYEIINLGCGNPVENLRFVQIIEKLVGKRAMVKEEPAPSSEPVISFADISKARKLLGFEPKVQVEEGLERFVRWMEQEQLL
jgi:UDP-glucuronate 4-epimerase